MVRFGTQPHQQLEPDTAGRLLEALFKEAPGVFGYFLAVAVTGVAPSRPRASHAAPDLQQPAGPAGPRLVEGGRK
jgi:hypothetical protein